MGLATQLCLSGGQAAIWPTIWDHMDDLNTNISYIKNTAFNYLFNFDSCRSMIKRNF